MTEPSRRDILLGAGAGALSSALPLVGAEQDAMGPFLVKPYVQLGDAPALSREEQLVLLWHAPDRDDAWDVTFRPSGSSSWSRAAGVKGTRLALPTVPPHRVQEALSRPLPPRTASEYRVRQTCTVVLPRQ